jgi:predicted nucleic acid-binding protein
MALLQDDEHMVVWWGTRVECVSALARHVREGGLDPPGETQARAVHALLAANWSEIQATDRVRSQGERLLAVHPLRAADALQLASALVWSDGVPAQRALVCLDDRLGEAARKEGFKVLPPD